MVTTVLAPGPVSGKRTKAPAPWTHPERLLATRAFQPGRLELSYSPHAGRKYFCWGCGTSYRPAPKQHQLLAKWLVPLCLSFSVFMWQFRDSICSQRSCNKLLVWLLEEGLFLGQEDGVANTQEKNKSLSTRGRYRRSKSTG